MKRSLLAGMVLGAWVLPLAACATSKLPKLPICDGKVKHRRDANPYGSVLPGAPAATSGPAPGPDDQHPGTLPPPPPPPKTSAIAHPSYFASC